MSYLSVAHLEKSFGSTRVLRDVSFDLPEGETLSVIGSSGSGKTTLLRCLNFLERPDAGVISLRDQTLLDGSRPPVRERELREKRLHFGLVFQDFNLFPQYTALENVTLARRLAKLPGESEADIRDRGLALLEQMGLSDRAGHYPHQLSGGQKQRVAIARALATDPKVLLCDEATSALDPTTTNSILALLKELNQKLGVTVVIITHQMSVIEEICTRVAILDGGEVAEEGRVEDIFAHPATDAARRLVYPGGVSAKQYPAGTRAVRVSFNGGTVYDPLIASLAIDCGVKVTILGADTRTIDGKAFGTMLLLLPDDPNEAAKALSYIRSQPNITAEEVEYHA